MAKDEEEKIVTEAEIYAIKLRNDNSKRLR